MAGFTSCSNDEEGTGVNVPGVETPGETGSLSLSFTTSDLSTRAISTTQTAAESTVATADIFIFRPSGVLETSVSYTVGTDMTNASGTYTSDTPISGLIAEAGKTVLIGVNMPSALVTQIKADAAANGNPLTKAYSVAQASLSAITTGNSFMMLGSTAATVTAGNTSSSATLTVSRLAAKATVVFDNTKITGTTVSIAGGTVDVNSLKWDVDNGNSDFHLVAPAAGSTAFTTTNPSPMVWSWKPIIGDDPGAAAVAATNSAYIMENIQATPDMTAGTNISFLRVQCTFIPTNLITGSAGNWVSGASGWSTATTFYTVSNANGTIAYFGTSALAAAYIADTASGAATGATVKTYTDGLVEYGIFLSKTAGKFDIVRNNYYVVTISGINGLGVPGGETTPPTIIPPTSKGSLDFSFTVTDWIPETSTESLQ